jgi:predicted nucleic acid-binding Zn finger protein
MKKMVLSLMIAMMACAMMAQEHMTFKGVEINGPQKEFVEQLKEKGFVYDGEENGVVIMRGDFAGYGDCEVAVITAGGEDVVTAVGVMFHEREEWTAIEADYNTLKTMLIEKYGRPYNVVEEFNGRVFDDNRLKFSYLTSDKCQWSSIFETELGVIELYIQQTSYNKAAVIMRYYDVANTEMQKSTAIDDL